MKKNLKFTEGGGVCVGGGYEWENTVWRRVEDCSSAQKTTGNKSEAALDHFPQFTLKIGHATPGYLGKTHPVQGYLAHKKHQPP